MQRENTGLSKATEFEGFFIIIASASITFSLADDAENEFEAVHTAENRGSVVVFVIQGTSIVISILTKNVLFEGSINILSEARCVCNTQQAQQSNVCVSPVNS